MSSHIAQRCQRVTCDPGWSRLMDGPARSAIRGKQKKKVVVVFCELSLWKLVGEDELILMNILWNLLQPPPSRWFMNPASFIWHVFFFGIFSDSKLPQFWHRRESRILVMRWEGFLTLSICLCMAQSSNQLRRGNAFFSPWASSLFF